ncbi:hypothetical protein [Poseidonocella sp. HB161398]|uniref:hypothetical protein n=1 Tax=Poseidonocella sp. HB161398 TaxID=2320855 RepID=UPI0011084BF2|nr:hypothetical protein [Poseidonocella sp. HB161398]
MFSIFHLLAALRARTEATRLWRFATATSLRLLLCSLAVVAANLAALVQIGTGPVATVLGLAIFALSSGLLALLGAESRRRVRSERETMEKLRRNSRLGL